MRSVSGARNRTVLVLLGLLLILAAAWIVSAATPLVQALPEADPVLPRGDSLIGDIAAAHQAWLLPVGLVLAVVAVLLGLALLLAQVPSPAPQSTLRITDDEDRVLGSVEPAVLERALVETLEETAGVLDASVRIGGSAGAPWVQSTVTVAAHAETGWVAETVRRRLVEDLGSVLGVAPVRTDLVVRLRSGATSRSARIEAAENRTDASRPVAAPA